MLFCFVSEDRCVRSLIRAQELTVVLKCQFFVIHQLLIMRDSVQDAEL